MFSDYGHYIEPLLNDNSFCFIESVSEILIFLDGDELLKDYLYRRPESETLNYLDEQLQALFSAIKYFIEKTSNPNLKLFINSIVFNPRNFVSYIPNNCGSGFDEVEQYTNSQIANFCLSLPNAILLNWSQIVRQYGYNSLYDDRFWYLGRIKCTSNAFKIMVSEMTKLRSAYTGLTKKVLVLDLDNTLWGGVVGEEGIDGIELSEDGIGKAYRDFQKLILSLKQLGIILCINSKNNENDVLQVFSNHPLMVLKKDDFIIRKINWENKAQNLWEISRELNIGIDTIVFIDDNPFERQLIKDNIPEIIVPDFPSDALLIPKWFIEEVVCRYFPKIIVSEEDKNKTKQYKALLERESFGKDLDFSSFIRGLKICLKLHLNSPYLITRIAQMTQKTNQFNLTTKRYTEADIANFTNDNNSAVFGLEYEDKFGKEGIVGACIIKFGGKTANVDTFLLSCRVVGRTVEYAFLKRILLELKNKGGIESVKLNCLPTAKNILAQNFYSSIVPDDCKETEIDKLIYNSESNNWLNGVEFFG
jgi:HAD-superfamily phosphatase, subfamily IIIC/FkbH-like domain